MVNFIFDHSIWNMHDGKYDMVFDKQKKRKEKRKWIYTMLPNGRKILKVQTF